LDAFGGLLQDGWKSLVRRFAVLRSNVSQQLVLAVVAVLASLGGGAQVGLVFHVSSLVVVTVADGRESLWAELALVGLLACVDADVYLQVASLVEMLVAELGLTSFVVGTDYFCADEILVLLFQIFRSFVFSFDRSEILLHKIVVVVLSSLLLKIMIFILIHVVDVGETEV
jgi:hypothetical protein